MTTLEEGKLVWTPSPAVRARARLTAFMRWLRETRGLAFDDYEALWRWSVTDLEAFWDAICDYFESASTRRPARVLARRRCRARAGSRARR